ncbi:phosphoglycerate mutase family protein [Pseudomonas fluorescens]|uniref:Phosphoglycerate mutase family protein n=1 Tax=Pseudomonas fluorescens TaxID=294 RepID=A0A3S4R5W9_PSEFL|nr:phosphoglycerate mutase family protein [Pseudomonas fluorescens]
MVRLSAQTWEELYAGMFLVDIEGWSITIFNDCDELDYS